MNQSLGNDAVKSLSYYFLALTTTDKHMEIARVDPYSHEEFFSK